MYVYTEETRQRQDGGRLGCGEMQNDTDSVDKH